MSYEKKYLPLNSDIKEEWDEREDRVESGFGGIIDTFKMTYVDLSANPGFLLGKFSEGWLHPRAYKANGFVFLEGAVRSDNTGDLLTLPKGYRPPGTTIFIVGGNSPANITIRANGIVTINTMGANAQLSGIVFRAA